MADLSYTASDTASIVAGSPAKASKVLSLFTTLRDYINAAAAWVDSKHLVDGSIDTAHLADDVVTAAKIDDGAVVEAALGAGSVTTTKLGDLAVTAAKLANDAVTEDKILDDAVTHQKLALNAVRADNILNGTITGAKLAADAVTVSSIADGTITYAKLDSIYNNDATIPAHPSYSGGDGPIRMKTFGIIGATQSLAAYAFGGDYKTVFLFMGFTLTNTTGSDLRGLTARVIEGASPIADGYATNALGAQVDGTTSILAIGLKYQ